MSKNLLTPKRILLLFIVLNLVVGLFTVSDYGISIDESQETFRAEVAMRRYTLNETGDPVAEYESLGINQYYGTVLMMVFLFFENTFRPMLGTARHDILHYTFFVTFQIGVYLIFVLARRWVKDWWAVAAAVLFGTQPLYYGHAFINPKDIPSMVIFIGTVVAGFWMADRLEAHQQPVPAFGRNLAGLMKADWQMLSDKIRRRLINVLTITVGLMLLWAARTHLWLVEVVIGAMYRADESSLLGKLFARFAPNAGFVPVEDYVARGQQMARLVMNGLLVVLLVGGVLLFLLFFKQVRRTLWQETFSIHLQKTGKMGRRGWLAVVLAGLLWGVAISTRATNIAAGGMVGLYVLLRLREKAVLPLIGYTLYAALACFITWPYLWYFGVEGFIGAVTAFSNYPYVGGRLWFRGAIPHAEIPRTFLLQVMAIQFTIPLVVLSTAGVVLGLVLAVRKKLPRLDVFILMCWFFLPMLYAIAARPTLYNNFRQFFFITPPLFVFAGLALEKVANDIKRGVLLGLVLLIVFAPGVVGMVQLHPYQYVYYNPAVGGVEGAYRYYEMDYWVISYKDAMSYINTYASEGAQIAMISGGDVPAQYARPDLKLVRLPSDITPEGLQAYEYVLLNTNHRHPLPVDLYALETVHAVTAGDVVLAYVKTTGP